MHENIINDAPCRGDNISPAYGTDLLLPLALLVVFLANFIFFFRFLMRYNQVKNEY